MSDKPQNQTAEDKAVAAVLKFLADEASWSQEHSEWSDEADDDVPVPDAIRFDGTINARDLVRLVEGSLLIRDTKACWQPIETAPRTSLARLVWCP